MTVLQRQVSVGGKKYNRTYIPAGTDLARTRGYYTVAELSKIMGLSRQRVYQMIEKGKIPMRKAPNGTLCILVKDYDKLIEDLEEVITSL